MSKQTNTHHYFWGGEFSNFYRCKIRYNGLNFNNTEQIFMWEKALYFEDSDTAALILKAADPKIAKSLGRSVKNFDEAKWSEVSYLIMKRVNMHKYSQNRMICDMLVGTGDRVLVEASPFDKIWGVGLSQDDDAILDEANWRGKNLLGKALMEVRDEMKKLSRYFVGDVTN